MIELQKLKGKLSVDDIEVIMKQGLELYYSAKGETFARNEQGEFNDFINKDRTTKESSQHVETK